MTYLNLRQVLPSPLVEKKWDLGLTQERMSGPAAIAPYSYRLAQKDTSTLSFSLHCMTSWLYGRRRRCRISLAAENLHPLSLFLHSSTPRESVPKLRLKRNLGSGSVRIYEAISNQSENCHVHDRPGRSRVVDSRQLIPFTFSVQTGQLTSLVIMTMLTLVGYCLENSSGSWTWSAHFA